MSPGKLLLPSISAMTLLALVAISLVPDLVVSDCYGDGTVDEITTSDCYGTEEYDGVVYALYEDHAEAVTFTENIPNELYIEHYYLPVTIIQDNAFYHCAYLNSVFLSEATTHIGDYAFAGSELKEIALSDTITYIGDYAFDNCQLISEITLPDTVTHIGDWALPDLDYVNIPTGLTEIGEGTFYCYRGEEITIPAGITSIGAQAFSEGMLSTVIFECEEPPTFGVDAFGYLQELTVYTPGWDPSIIAETSNNTVITWANPPSTTALEFLSSPEVSATGGGKIEYVGNTAVLAADAARVGDS